MKFTILIFLFSFAVFVGSVNAQYRNAEPATCSGQSNELFTVYKDKTGWYVQNCASVNMTGQLKFNQTNNVFAIEDCLAPNTRKFLWWMTANPTLSLSVVSSKSC